MNRQTVLILTLAIAAISCGCRKASSGPAAQVAATNSYLECAVRDLLGQGTAILRLAEPGMCPGHFDIRPSQVQEVRRCRLLLRFDFQKSLDVKVTADSGGLQIVEVRIPGGLCDPASYMAACHQVADALVAGSLLDRHAADGRLKAIALRLEEKEGWCQKKVAGLKDTPVVTSTHQEAFCRWLGLKVVATFSGADVASVSKVDRAVRDGEQAGVKLVIANLPEGRRVADALAVRLGAKVVVLGNFPALIGGQSSFDDLLEANVNALVEAAGK